MRISVLLVGGGVGWGIRSIICFPRGHKWLLYKNLGMHIVISVEVGGMSSSDQLAVAANLNIWCVSFGAWRG